MLDLRDGGPLQIWVRPGWRERLDPLDRDYLLSLIGEWKATAPSEVPALFDELARQSRGLLRAVSRGEQTGPESTARTEGYVRQ